MKTDRFRYNIGWGERWKQNGLGIILVGERWKQKGLGRILVGER